MIANVQDAFRHEIKTIPVDETDLWFIEFDMITLENMEINDEKMLEIIATFNAHTGVPKDKDLVPNEYI